MPRIREAHELFTLENWDQAPLREVVTRALKPFAPSRADRIALDGPAILLPAKTSLMLTMCLHELATNAAKYGALSNDEGTVHLGWELVSNGGASAIKLSWRESGGPPVQARTQRVRLAAHRAELHGLWRDLH